MLNAVKFHTLLLPSAFQKSIYKSIRTGKCRGAKGCTHHHNGNLTEYHEAAVLLPKPVVSLRLRRTTVVA